MPKVRGDRRPNGPIWWLLMAIAIYAVAAASLAIATADACGGNDFDTKKEWKWFPPEWECAE